MQLVKEIGVKNLKAYGDSRPSSIRFARSTKSDMKTVLYHNSTIIMAEKFENFYIDHVPRQQNAHADALASLTASLALPAGATERVLVHSRNLYCCKFALGDSRTPRRDLQVKELLETSTSLEPRD